MVMEPIRPVDHVDLGLLLGVADRLTAAIAGATTAVAHPNSRWLFVGEQSPRQAFSYSESSWRIRHQGPQQWAGDSRLPNRAASSRSRSPGRHVAPLKVQLWGKRGGLGLPIYAGAP